METPLVYLDQVVRIGVLKYVIETEYQLRVEVMIGMNQATCCK